jgi:hypothetical protein
VPGIDIDFSKVVGSSNRFSSFVALIIIMEMMNLSIAFFSLCDFVEWKLFVHNYIYICKCEVFLISTY